jgi:hypothetical protein
MFAGMPSSRCIVAGLDDLGTELLVVRDIQFFFVIQESVEFFSFEKIVDQFVRAFLTEYFESLGDFDFLIGAVSNFLFECWRFGKSGGSKHDETFRVKYQLIPIIFSICDLKTQEARERVGYTVFLAWLVN